MGQRDATQVGGILCNGHGAVMHQTRENLVLAVLIHQHIGTLLEALYQPLASTVRRFPRGSYWRPKLSKPVRDLGGRSRRR